MKENIRCWSEWVYRKIGGEKCWYVFKVYCNLRLEVFEGLGCSMRREGVVELSILGGI